MIGAPVSNTLMCEQIQNFRGLNPAHKHMRLSCKVKGYICGFKVLLGILANCIKMLQVQYAEICIVTISFITIPQIFAKINTVMKRSSGLNEA